MKFAKSPWFWVVSIGMGFCVILIAISSFFLWNVRKDLERAAAMLPAERRAAIAENVPLEGSDLSPNPPIPDNQNAAFYYKQIVATLRGPFKPKADVIIKLERRAFAKKDRPSDAQLEEGLAKMKAIMDLAEKAAALKDCDFKHDYGKGAEIVLPEFGPMRNSATLLNVRAYFEAKRGDGEQATRTLLESATIARHIGQEPILIGKLAQIATNTLVLQALQEVAFIHPKGFDLDRDSQRVWAALGAPADLKSALRGECVLDVQTARGLSRGITTNFVRLSTGAQAGAAYETRVIQYFRDIFKKLPKNPDDLLPAYELLNDGPSAPWDKPSYMLLKVIEPVYGQAVLTMIADRVRREMSRAEMDLIKYKEKNGQYPERLDQVGKYTDYFVGAQVHYKRGGKGFLLYSVGPNMRDDGGTKAADAAGNMQDLVMVDCR